MKLICLVSINAVNKSVFCLWIDFSQEEPHECYEKFKTV